MPRAGLMQMMRGTVSMRDMRSTPSHGLSHEHRQPDVPGGGGDDIINGDSKPSRSPGRRKFQKRRQTVDSSTPSVRAGMEGVAADDASSPGRRGQGQEAPPTLVGVISDLVTIPSYNPQNQQAGQRPTKATYDLIQNKRWDLIPAACVDRPSDARYSDGKNHLPIHWACYYGAPLDVVTALHEAHEGGVDSINLKGDLPLHRACRGRASPDVVRFVRDANPDGSSVENHYGETPVDLLDVSGRSYREREAVREVFHPRPAVAATAAMTHRFGGGGSTVAVGYGGAPLRHSHVDVPPSTVVPGGRSGSAVASSGTGRASFDATSRPGGRDATAAAIGFGPVVGDAPPHQPVAPATPSDPRLSATAAGVAGPKNAPAPAPATIPEGPSYSSSLDEDEYVSNEVVSDDNKGPNHAGPGAVSPHQPQLRRRRSAGASSVASGASGAGPRAPNAAAASPPPVARSTSATAAETEAAARQAARAGWIARRDDMGPLGDPVPPSAAARSASSSSASAALEARAAAAQADVAAREAERAAHVARRASARLDEAAAEARRARAEAEEARRRAAEMRRVADEAEGRMLAEARRASAAEDESRRMAGAGRVGAVAVAPGTMPGDEGGGGRLFRNAGGDIPLHTEPVRAAGFTGGDEGGVGGCYPSEDGGDDAIPLPPEPV